MAYIGGIIDGASMTTAGAELAARLLSDPEPRAAISAGDRPAIRAAAQKHGLALRSGKN